MQIKCQRCGLVFKAVSEQDAEAQFSEHKCQNMRDLTLMPTDLLLKLAKGQITEEQAWQEAGTRINAGTTVD